MKRLCSAIAVLLAVLALPAAALASSGSPLLSGYGGPGSGDQAVLGGGLVSGGSGGSGGSGSSGASTSLRAAAPSTSSSTTTSGSGSTSTGSSTTKGTTSGGASGSTTHHAHAHGTSTTTSTTPSHAAAGGTTSTSTQSTPAAGLPHLATTPVKASSGAFPLSGRDLLLALVVALAIAALAVATHRLSRGLAGPGTTDAASGV